MKSITTILLRLLALSASIAAILSTVFSEINLMVTLWGFTVQKIMKALTSMKIASIHGLPPSPSEVQRQIASIILGFEQGAFLPKLQIKARGRKKGDIQDKRKRHKAVWKGKKAKKKQA